MFRKSLDRFSGMLFVYDGEQKVNFWMRNTFIPLDLLFFDSKGILRKIHHNAKPLDLTNIFGGDSIQYVLEINAGLSAALGDFRFVQGRGGCTRGLGWVGLALARRRRQKY